MNKISRNKEFDGVGFSAASAPGGPRNVSDLRPSRAKAAPGTRVHLKIEHWMMINLLALFIVNW
ncbi:hypothetical protein DPMN_076672 [Dreissena polymorpha]|uniref:Uncharacterized protein n=1 Tax=Dreissena polymorpha TaxID=45954 RepID=A0A9D3YLZ4_DREPO|nr:hypothetical protein DPMN_076672 [Dreissena polymorpha]